VEEVPDVLINLPGTLLTVFFFSSVVSVLTGLCRVPFLSSAAPFHSDFAAMMPTILCAP